MFAPELSAGRIDIGSELAANRSADALLFKSLSERLDLFRARRHQTRFLYGIYGDEVYVDGEFFTARGFSAKRGVKDTRKKSGVGGRGVLTVDEGVLKGDAASRCAPPLKASGKELRDIPTVVDGHDLVTHLVGGGVERDRESDGKIFLHQLADAINVSAGREGDVAVTDANSALVVNKTKEAEDVIVVVHRLADAHKYYV